MTTFLLGLALGGVVAGRLAWLIAADTTKAELRAERQDTIRDWIRARDARAQAARDRAKARLDREAAELARKEADAALNSAMMLGRHEANVLIYGAAAFHN